MRKRFATLPDGSDASYPLIVLAGAAPGPTAALIAGVHGDEYEGPAALWRVLAGLDPAALRGRVVAVPVAHLAALAAGTRESPVDGVNLARVFPGDAGGTVTLRLAQDLFATAVRPAELLVDLHSGGVRYAFVRVAGFYDTGNGITPDVAAGSRRLARATGLPFLWRLPPRPGVLSFEAARAGLAVTGCEAGGRGGCAEGDVAAYVAGVLGVLSEAGMIDAAPVSCHPAPAAFLDGDFALAPVAGLYEPVAELGARVPAGAPLARIRGIEGAVLATLRAETDCVVMAERHLRAIHAGEWATCAPREQPF